MVRDCTRGHGVSGFAIRPDRLRLEQFKYPVIPAHSPLTAGYFLFSPNSVIVYHVRGGR